MESTAGVPHCAAGLDLVAPSARPEIYLDQLAWAELAPALRLREERSAWTALVRVVNPLQLLKRLYEDPRLRSMGCGRYNLLSRAQGHWSHGTEPPLMSRSCGAYGCLRSMHR